MRNLFRLLEGKLGVADSWERLVSQHQVVGKQTHDAHIVATMQVYRVRHPLTFNGDDFRRFESVEIIDPASVAVGH